MTPFELIMTPLPEMGESGPPDAVLQRILIKAERVCVLIVARSIAGCVVIWILIGIVGDEMISGVVIEVFFTIGFGEFFIFGVVVEICVWLLMVAPFV